MGERRKTKEFSRKRIYLVFYSMKFKHVYTEQIYAILFVNHSLGRRTHGFMVTNMVSSHPTFSGERRGKSNSDIVMAQSILTPD